MEKLGQLHGAPSEWDLIVVDTPPTRSALDFLDAPAAARPVPRRPAHPAADSPRPRRAACASCGCSNAGFGMCTGALTKLLGAQVLKDVQTFVAALDTMFGGFRERAEATYRLLQAPGTAFLVVAAPEPDALREASYFVERLVPGAHAARRAGGQPRAHLGRPAAAAPHGAWPPPRPWKCRISRTGRARRPPVLDRRGGAAHARGADAPEQAGAAPGRALHLGAPGHPGRRGDRAARGRARPRRAAGDRRRSSRQEP